MLVYKQNVLPDLCCIYYFPMKGIIDVYRMKVRLQLFKRFMNLKSKIAIFVK